MKKYDKLDFEIMVNDWMSDHAKEMSDLSIGDIYFDEDLGWTAEAEDEKSTYVLTDDGAGDIRIHYIGTKQ